MPDMTFRLTWVCSHCGGSHRKRGPIGFVMRGAAHLVDDEGAKCVQIAEEGWAQEADIDFMDWLQSKGVNVGEDVEWGSFSHRKG